MSNINQTKRIPRGIRNNNPGNIRHGSSRWVGMAEHQMDPQFVSFKAIKWGYRALIKLLRNYIDYHGADTVEKIVKRWAPVSDGNDPDKYIRIVTNRTGMYGNYEPDPSDMEDMCLLATAIAYVETGVEPDMEDAIEGFTILDELPESTDSNYRATATIMRA